HTDTLHTGFALPGYENGAAAAHETTPSDELTEPTPEVDAAAATEGATPEQQIQALEAALANRNVTMIFQGGVVGLVLGGTTAWFIANNLRSARREDEHEPVTS